MSHSLPAGIHSEWNCYYSQLPLLNNIRFPHKTVIKSASEIELHGFCNASEKAYRVCVYLRTANSYGHLQTRLLAAKSKVASLKSQTIPRLELSEALLLTALTATILQALAIKIKTFIVWILPSTSIGSIHHHIHSQSLSLTA